MCGQDGGKKAFSIVRKIGQIVTQCIVNWSDLFLTRGFQLEQTILLKNLVQGRITLYVHRYAKKMRRLYNHLWQIVSMF